MLNFGPSLIKPARWPLQPHLTAAPELWRPQPIMVLPYWHRGTLKDVSGRANDAALVNSPTPTVVKSGFAYDYDGTSQYADAGGTVDGLAGATRLTFITQVVLDDVSNDAHDSSIIRKWKSGAQACIVSLTRPAFGEPAEDFRFVINDNSQNNILGVKTTNQPLLVGTIHTLGGVWRGGNSIDLYLDGVKQPTSIEDNNSPSEIADVTEHLSLMARYNGGAVDNFVDGKQSFVFLSPEEFSDAVMEAATADPFALLRPGPQAIPMLFGNAGATQGTTVTDTALITAATATPLMTADTALATDAATITSATASSLLALDTATAFATAVIVQSSATSLTAVEAAIVNDTAQITDATATLLTADESASATDTANITAVIATPLTASETTETTVVVDDTAQITPAFATILTAVETAIANDTATVTQATATPLTAQDNMGELISATSTAQLTIPAPGSTSLTMSGNLPTLTIPAGSTSLTLPAPASTSLTMPAPGSTALTIPTPPES